jgi:hypothetical protein
MDCELGSLWESGLLSCADWGHIACLKGPRQLRNSPHSKEGLLLRHPAAWLALFPLPNNTSVATV